MNSDNDIRWIISAFVSNKFDPISILSSSSNSSNNGNERVTREGGGESVSLVVSPIFANNICHVILVHKELLNYRKPKKEFLWSELSTHRTP